MGPIALVGLLSLTIIGIVWTIRSAGGRAIGASVASVAFGIFVIQLGIQGIITDRVAVVGALFVFGPIYVLPVVAWWRRRQRP